MQEKYFIFYLTFSILLFIFGVLWRIQFYIGFYLHTPTWCLCVRRLKVCHWEGVFYVPTAKSLPNFIFAEDYEIEEQLKFLGGQSHKNPIARKDTTAMPDADGTSTLCTDDLFGWICTSYELSVDILSLVLIKIPPWGMGWFRKGTYKKGSRNGFGNLYKP